MNNRRKQKRLIPAAFAFLFAVVLTLGGCGGNVKEKERPMKAGNGLFSWHDEVFDKEERETLFRLMRENGLTDLYQDIPRVQSTSQVKGLISACGDAGINVYLLVGDPSWALDPSAWDLREEIQRAALLGCAGIMVDIEPGAREEWHEDRSSVMDSMTEGFVAAKAAAEAEGLKMIVCLSWYYDDLGLTDGLKRIVSEGCDVLAIMNYDRRDEAGQIRTEAALCKTYGRELISIYELQAAGQYELEEIHTYHEEGLPALKESWEKLREAYPDQPFSMALHEYWALKEAMS